MSRRGETLLVFLHGFLGQGSDWKSLIEQLKSKSESGKKFQYWTPNLLSSNSALNPDLSFAQWSQAFADEVRHFNCEKSILVGYSMGGRLALHAMVENPQLFSGGIFISTNPVLLNSQKSEERVVEDLKWSKRFLREDWENMIKEWNQQEVFSNESFQPQRVETDYSRKYLSLALKNWSLSQHRAGWKELQNLSIPTLWMAGKRDSKYVAIINYLKNQGLEADFIVLEGGHRLGLRGEETVGDRIIQFLEKC